MPKVAENMMAEFIRQTEQRVNELRARHSELMEDMTQVEAQLAEARGVLHSLKTAKVTPITNGNDNPPRAGEQRSMDDYLTFIAALEGEFTTTTIASGMNVTLGAARSALRHLVAEGIVTVVREATGTGGHPQKVYRQCS